MPARMGISELRETLTTTIRRVRAGETIEITQHDQPVAMLTPVRSDRIEQLLQAGDITPGEPLERPLRRFRATAGVTATAALEGDRAAH